MFFQDGTNYIRDEIEYICKLIFEVIKTPIYFLDNNNDIFFSLSYEHAANPILPNKKDLFTNLFSDCNSYNFPMVKSTKYHENYFAVNLRNDNIFLGTFIVGPSIYSSITAEAINKMISENNILLSYKRDLINFYNSIQVIDYSRLINASLLLHYSIYNEKLNVSTVMENNSSLKDIVLKIENDGKNILSKNRQDLFFHHSPTREKNLLLCIREGNKEKLLQYLAIPEDGQYGILSGSPLRNKKNFFICCATIATRAAIDGGLEPELAYALSDSYIQNMEYLYKVTDLLNLENKMYCDFADNVLKFKKLNYSRSIIVCQNYILKHLYEEISLSELAQFVGLSQKYLSGLFSKEVGITLSDYIQNARIEESKHLLTSSNYSILDIGTWLGFHDQSHFTRIFKKFTGTTPKKFKDGKTPTVPVIMINDV
ncbi:AraC family transcriptional regulator [Clostridium estertheticum]|uniref:AraC family transcriptional regulator n=1 Tax=Clostridium estertheticum TaxID=238834 RepID=UPI001CF54642|nr:helix-turn-helix domain-containing protein [Clostridium estertheticum]MCB2354571.1 helix-turn-helix domain-containing protein [Clostridium estertheticum]MCB2358498.1 helix-turn-helix domain-containing protein [Clostridium estertheticum]WAG40820.1 helix-turn-helix domain-containing protein [Clostridium estertheticum]